MKYILGLASLVIILGGDLAVAQESYLPLAEGNTWSYLGLGGERESTVISGQTEIFGYDVWVMEYFDSDHNEELENYWTSDETGDVYLWGAWRGWGQVYDPPIKMVDAPLEVGKTWSTTFDRYSLPDLEFVRTETIHFEVQEAGVIAVPAGDFEAFNIIDAGDGGVEYAGAVYNVLGERLQPNQRVVDSWWSLGVGEIQYVSSDTYQLTSFEVGPVATEHRTWSGVKVLFQ